MGIGPIRVLKDERVVDAVSLALRLLPTPCRGTICTFDLARLPNFYTCRAYAHVMPTHIDIYVLPFLRPLFGKGLPPSWGWNPPA